MCDPLLFHVVVVVVVICRNISFELSSIILVRFLVQPAQCSSPNGAGMRQRR